MCAATHTTRMYINQAVTLAGCLPSLSLHRSWRHTQLPPPPVVDVARISATICRINNSASDGCPWMGKSNQNKLTKMLPLRARMRQKHPSLPPLPVGLIYMPPLCCAMNCVPILTESHAAHKGWSAKGASLFLTLTCDVPPRCTKI